jgi:hypothetical protein
MGQLFKKESKADKDYHHATMCDIVTMTQSRGDLQRADAASTRVRNSFLSLLPLR